MTEKQLKLEFEIKQNLNLVRERIKEACDKAGRDLKDVSLLGVTKTVEPERINMAIDAGLDLIGENRVQELLSKNNEINITPDKIHLIGHLQTNKVSKIVGEVSMVHSVDRVRLAESISRYSLEKGIVTDVLVQVNIGDETTKSGVDPADALGLLEEISAFEGIKVKGLMTIPPIFHTESEKRQVFSQMYKLFVDIKGKNIDNIIMETLSMGMSGDFYEAILEGATLVRVGSAIFGSRG